MTNGSNRSLARLFQAKPASAPSVATLEPAKGDEELTLYNHWIQQIADVCDAAAQGDLELRLLHCPDSPNLARAVTSINHLLDMTDALLRETRAALEHAAEKKFYRRVLLRGMRGSFQHTAEQINTTTQQLADDAAELSKIEASRRTLSEGVKNVVDGLSSTANRMHTTAESLSEMAHGSAGGSATGKTGVGKSHHLRQAVMDLKDASQRIGGVVKLISEIAAQTNMLALNATIEGARAGEAGRGFAVVANEVKALSKKTSSATGEIEKEITSVRAIADLTSKLVSSLSQTIAELKDLSQMLNRQSDELAGSMVEFLGKYSI